VARVLITGAGGFLGRNLCWRFASENISKRFHAQAGAPLEEVEVLTFTRQNSLDDLRVLLDQADFVYHLAGVNRPQFDQEFDQINRGLTEEILHHLEATGHHPPVLFASSTQAEMENLYGLSKKAAEHALINYHKRTRGPVLIYQLTNLFGKWCRPNYNSVTATFCHNLAHDLPIQIHDKSHQIGLLYVDDVTEEFSSRLKDYLPKQIQYHCGPTYEITLGDLAERLRGFVESRKNLFIPDFADPLTKKLYATYVSYLKPGDFSYPLTMRNDARGSLAEVVKSPHFGQIFVSTTKPGVTRGNHFHHTKVEKFIVIQGEGLIEFRQVDQEEILQYPVSGEQIQVLDIPTGYTHRITNTSKTKELVTLFWSCEPFNPEAPDTYFLEL